MIPMAQTRVENDAIYLTYIVYKNCKEVVIFKVDDGNVTILLKDHCQLDIFKNYMVFSKNAMQDPYYVSRIVGASLFREAIGSLSCLFQLTEDEVNSIIAVNL